MSDRYRKLGAWVWTDARLDDFAKPSPNPQYLYMYLLAGPNAMALPCASRIGEAGLSEELGWSVEDFRRCFAELEKRNLVEADWKARVVYVPDAFKDNIPKSVTVIVAWRKAFNELPACPLKAKIYTRVTELLAGLSDGFLKVFGKDLDTSFVKTAWVQDPPATDKSQILDTAARSIKTLDADDIKKLDADDNTNLEVYDIKPNSETEDEDGKIGSPQKPPVGAFVVTEQHFNEVRSGYPEPGRKRRKQALRHFRASVKSEADLIDCRAALENYVDTRLRENAERAARAQNPIPWMNDSTWFNNWRDWIPRPVEPIGRAAKNPAEFPEADPELCEFWDGILRSIQGRFNPQTFQTWFLPTRPIRREGSVLSIAVPNGVFEDWLRENATAPVLEALIPEGITSVCFLPGRIRVAETMVVLK